MNVKEQNSTKLTNKASALASEFALVLYRLEGKLIDVDSEDAMTHISLRAHRSKDVYLRGIYMQIRQEIRNTISNSASETTAVSL